MVGKWEERFPTLNSIAHNGTHGGWDLFIFWELRRVPSGFSAFFEWVRLGIPGSHHHLIKADGFSLPGGEDSILLVSPLEPAEF